MYPHNLLQIQKLVIINAKKRLTLQKRCSNYKYVQFDHLLNAYYRSNSYIYEIVSLFRQCENCKKNNQNSCIQSRYIIDTFLSTVLFRNLVKEILGHMKTNIMFRILYIFFYDGNINIFIINMFINSIIDTCTNDALNYMSQITPEFFQ